MSHRRKSGSGRCWVKRLKRKKEAEETEMKQKKQGDLCSFRFLSAFHNFAYLDVWHL